MRQHLAGEAHFLDAERAAHAAVPAPGEEEADELPHRVETEAPGHDRVLEKMTGEEPQGRLDVELRAHFTAPVGAALSR